MRGLDFLRRIGRVMYWALPLVLLGVIFARMDIPALVELMKGLRLLPLMAGLLTTPLGCLLGAWRWRVLMEGATQQPVSYGFALKHYYAGLGVGYFSPGLIGWDVYRVAVAGRRYGHYRTNLVAVLLEKVAALLVAALLVGLLYPLVRDRVVTHAAWLHGAWLWGWASAVLLVVVFFVVRLLRGQAVTRWAGCYARRILDVFVERAARVLPDVRRFVAAPGPLFLPFASGRVIGPVLILSVAMLAIGAVGTEWLFLAMGRQVPFGVNLFVVPVMLLLFALPISFGGVGVREGSHILLYGLFGLSKETALLASMLSLLGVLLNQVIGVLVLWWCGAEWIRGLRANARASTVTTQVGASHAID